ncbi:MAG: VanZ family protein [Roseburia sp.]|nr:VanZ family protein [Roseburia sp.]
MMTADYIKRLFLLLLAVLPVYIILRRFVVKVRKGGKGEGSGFWLRETVMALFFSFLAVLLFFTLFDGLRPKADFFSQGAARILKGEKINLIPFRTIRECFYHMSLDRFLINIIGNIIMFLPWGFSLPFLWEKFRSLSKMAALSLLLPVCIETSQIFVGRTVDVDDVILNFLGGFLGAWIYMHGKEVLRCFGQNRRP